MRQSSLRRTMRAPRNPYHAAKPQSRRLAGTEISPGRENPPSPRSQSSSHSPIATHVPDAADVGEIRRQGSDSEAGYRRTLLHQPAPDGLVIVVFRHNQRYTAVVRLVRLRCLWGLERPGRIFNHLNVDVPQNEKIEQFGVRGSVEVRKQGRQRLVAGTSEHRDF